MVLIHDLSMTGLLIETSAALPVGGHLDIELPETGMRQATVVWNSGKYFGCQLREPISRAGLSAALLKSPAEGSSSAEVGEAEDKLPLGKRLWIMIALALASWAVILLVFSLI